MRREAGDARLRRLTQRQLAFRWSSRTSDERIDDGRLAGAVLADDKVDVRIELHLEVLVVHEVLEHKRAQHAILVLLLTRSLDGLGLALLGLLGGPRLRVDAELGAHAVGGKQETSKRRRARASLFGGSATAAALYLRFLCGRLLCVHLILGKHKFFVAVVNSLGALGLRHHMQQPGEPATTTAREQPSKQARLGSALVGAGSGCRGAATGSGGASDLPQPRG